MTTEEKFSAMLKNFERAEKDGAAVGDHLRDEDFMRLIENKTTLKTDVSPDSNGNLSAVADEFAPLRRHLLACESCLDQFEDFHAFFAPAERTETTAGKREIEAAWKQFAPRVTEKKLKPKIWARLFPIEKKSNYFAAFGWAFAALLLLFTGFAAFIAWQAKSENSQLAEQLEQQRQSSEERLKTLEQTAQNEGLAEQEKTRLQDEKAELEKRVAALQTKIEQAGRQREIRDQIVSPPNTRNPSTEKSNNSLVAVNTPIYDIFPADAVVRGGDNQPGNKFVVPSAAKNIVLILNAAGRADFPVYQAALINNAGKIVWRGGGLRKDATGNFTLTIARAALKAGNFRLKLSSDAQTVAEYPIVVEIGK